MTFVGHLAESAQADGWNLWVHFLFPQGIMELNASASIFPSVTTPTFNGVHLGALKGH